MATWLKCEFGGKGGPAGDDGLPRYPFAWLEIVIRPEEKLVEVVGWYADGFMGAKLSASSLLACRDNVAELARGLGFDLDDKTFNDQAVETYAKLWTEGEPALY